MKIKKRDKIILVSVLVFLVSFISWGKVSMIWSETTCAKIISLKRSRGYYVWFLYERNGEIVKDNMSLSFFSAKSLYNLQKKECCFIRYSKLWPYKVEIIDTDLKAKN